MLKHGVGLLVQPFQLCLVVTEFVPLIQYQLGRGVPLQFHILTFLRGIAGNILNINLTILLLFVQICDGLGPLLATGLSYFADISSKRLGHHLRMQTGELLEKLLEHELLCQGEGVDRGQSHVVKLTPLASHHIVIADIPVIDFARRYQDPAPLHVSRALHFFYFGAV